MPAIALALFAVFSLLGFGWRSWLQYRRTGSTGFKGFSGSPGSAEWFAGIGFAVALVIAVAAPALQWAGLVSPVPIMHSSWVQVAGLLLAALGIAGTVYAQLGMGDSWRIGVDATETTTLVHTGVFGVVRNPIYTAMLTFGVGIALTTPNPVALTGLSVLVVALELQTRLVEEPYLLAVQGDSYRHYTAKVGRFIPGVGLIDRTR